MFYTITFPLSTQPKIRRSLYEGFVEEFIWLFEYMNKKLSHAQLTFNNNQQHHEKVRTRKVLALFVNIVCHWRDMISRAQLAIGHGGQVRHGDLADILVDGGENPSGADLSALELLLREYNYTMQSILLHAGTRLIDDGGL